MADVLAWADKLPDIIKKWILIIPMILAVVGSSTGIYQYVDKKEVITTAEEKKNTAVREVATAFQQVIVDPEPDKTPNTSCSNCRTYWIKDVNNLETKLENKWHK